MKHTLVSGGDRSERQMALRGLVSSVERETPHVEVWLAASGAAQADLEWSPARFASGDEVRNMMEDAYGVLEDNASYLARLGEDSLEPTSARPLLVLVIDGADEVLAGAGMVRLVEDIMSRGQKAGVVLFAAGESLAQNIENPLTPGTTARRNK